MANSNLVDVLNPRNDLLEEPACLLLLKPLSFDDIVEQLASVCVFHDEEQLARGLDDFIELNDIGVSDDLKDVDLSSHPLHIRLVLDLVFLEYFDGYFLPSD